MAIYALCAKCGGVILYGCLRRPMWLFMPCVRSVVCSSDCFCVCVCLSDYMNKRHYQHTCHTTQ